MITMRICIVFAVIVYLGHTVFATDDELLRRHSKQHGRRPSGSPPTLTTSTPPSRMSTVTSSNSDAPPTKPNRPTSSTIPSTPSAVKPHKSTVGSKKPSTSSAVKPHKSTVGFSGSNRIPWVPSPGSPGKVNMGHPNLKPSVSTLKPPHQGADFKLHTTKHRIPTVGGSSSKPLKSDVAPLKSKHHRYKSSVEQSASTRPSLSTLHGEWTLNQSNVRIHAIDENSIHLQIDEYQIYGAKLYEQFELFGSTCSNGVFGKISRIDNKLRFSLRDAKTNKKLARYYFNLIGSNRLRVDAETNHTSLVNIYKKVEPLDEEPIIKDAPSRRNRTLAFTKIFYDEAMKKLDAFLPIALKADLYVEWREMKTYKAGVPKAASQPAPKSLADVSTPLGAFGGEWAEVKNRNKRFRLAVFTDSTVSLIKDSYHIFYASLNGEFTISDIKDGKETTLKAAFKYNGRNLTFTVNKQKTSFTVTREGYLVETIHEAKFDTKKYARIDGTLFFGPSNGSTPIAFTDAMESYALRMKATIEELRSTCGLQ